MTVAFTICCNNYLAHAKTVGDSYLRHHPDHKFIIALVDKVSQEMDWSGYSAFEIIEVEELKMQIFAELLFKYSLVELSTAVKPAFFHHIFKKYSADNVIYIDPDIMVFSPFDEVLDILKEKNFIITPHICTPIDDEYAPTDYHTIRGGIFNLGFIALSNYSKVTTFLDWWHERVVKYGYADFERNMFYDQLWINYLPVMFDNYFILKHPGYNMAGWNLHERKLSGEGQQYMVNGDFALRFFHFSRYDFRRPDIICGYLTRYSFKDRPDLIPLFNVYQKELEKNQVEKIRDIPVYYYPSRDKSKKKNLLPLHKRVSRRLRDAARVLIYGR